MLKFTPAWPCAVGRRHAGARAALGGQRTGNGRLSSHPLAIDRAQNWDQFESAVERWKVPSENLVYADRQGNIGEHSAGLAPIRKWTGLLPVPGVSGTASSVHGAASYEWSGFVPTSELPHFFNPKDGFVATANHKMIPQHYPYNVGFEWAPGYRVTRIRSVIGDAKQKRHKLTVEDMGGIPARGH